MYTTYILLNLKNKKYIGSTSDLVGRLKMHNDVSLEKAKFHRTTYKKGLWTVLFSKEFTTRKDASEFERFLKTGQGREWLKANCGAPASGG